MKNLFSKQQLKDWRRYESVRSKGAFNMFDPAAREVTGLSKERYEFAMTNYEKLEATVLSLKEGTK